MVEHQGAVQRDLAAHPGQFEPATEHARFASGDALRTAAGAHARLELPASGAVLVQADTTIRLWRGARAGLRVKVQTGVANVIAARAIELQTELGVAVLQAGSELRVRPSRTGQRYDITLGRASLTNSRGEQIELAAGEGIGAAIDDKPEEPTAEPEPVPPPPASERLAPLELGDLELRPGTSATIYDPEPPSRVHLLIPDRCSAGARLAVRGEPELTLTPTQALLLAAGTHDYRLLCLDTDLTPDTTTGAQEWRGTLRVIKNPGTAQLPRSAPTNSIDVDGRAYTVLFQNLPPVLEVKWPAAPTASGYTLRVQLEAGAPLILSLDSPMHVFAPGALPEGRHQLQFATQPSKAGVKPLSSRKTTLDLRFDNASPMASLRAPAVAGFDATTSVHVAGLALPDAQVSVLGQRFALDAQQRFAGDVTLPAGTRTIAVRIHHPRTGTRYYVRRVRPAP
jgi:hypothetical protein